MRKQQFGTADAWISLSVAKRVLSGGPPRRSAGRKQWSLRWGLGGSPCRPRLPCNLQDAGLQAPLRPPGDRRFFVIIFSSAMPIIYDGRPRYDAPAQQKHAWPIGR
jgi:hypothetical protein